METFVRFLDHSDHDKNLILLSPKFEKLRPSLVDFLQQQQIEDRVIFLSSGATSQNPKGYIFTKEALLFNAQAVNRHLKLTPDDRWGLTLPPFHIGGLSLFFRSSLLSHTPIDLHPWSPETLVQKIYTDKVTVISLVPTQIYDLVRLKIKAPQHLRYVLAGGDFLSQSLEQEAMKLGWPILRTFGMSEVGSQLATALAPGLKDLKILTLHDLKADEENRLWVKTPSLFSAEIIFNDGWSMKAAQDRLDSQGYYPLPDKGILSGGHLTHLGRYDGKVKVAGRLIDFLELKEKLDTHMLFHDCWGKIDLFIQPDERKSNIICLEYDKSVSFDIIEGFYQKISPIKVDQTLAIDFFVRNELGKKIRFLR